MVVSRSPFRAPSIAAATRRGVGIARIPRSHCSTLHSQSSSMLRTRCLSLPVFSIPAEQFLAPPVVDVRQEINQFAHLAAQPDMLQELIAVAVDVWVALRLSSKGVDSARYTLLSAGGRGLLKVEPEPTAYRCCRAKYPPTQCHGQTRDLVQGLPGPWCISTAETSIWAYIRAASDSSINTLRE